jgi:LPS-assembly protein
MTVDAPGRRQVGATVPHLLRLLRLLAVATALLSALLLIDPGSATAQTLSFPPRPPQPEPRQGPANGQMLVQANQIQYDYTNERVSAVGNVQIYYKGSTIQANRVVYDQKTKRLHAEGNATLTEPNGQVTHGEIMDLSDDYRDGFVDSLRIELPDQSRIAATRADRTSGRYTVFQNGVYTACEPCKDNPTKPPQWQVKAARIIHDQTDHMIYFEDAKLEVFGFPIAYFPYFSTPDPTVKRKTGWLPPLLGSSSRVGYSFGAPFFWALAPDYDVTLTPTITTRQGPLLQAEWRQRLINGAYYIRGSGIFQQDPKAFVFPDGTPQPGYGRDFRGTIESAGQFSFNDKWVWGWDAIAPTDKYFYQDYRIATLRQTQNLLQTTPTEGISDLYLTGRGDRSYFDARSIYFYGFTPQDDQGRLPIIHPVVDYFYVFGNPILGGELSYTTNLTSLSRQSASLDPISATATAGGLCAPTSANPNVKIPANCLLRGFPGSYTRFSAEVNWRRSIVDGIGQVFTPFASLRADAAAVSVSNQPGVSNYLPIGDASLARAMPTIGLEYRYPFIGVQSWGTQTIEPIAQIIIRPNETEIGRFPNEDSQSLLFDDTNLFKIDKFAGYDRIEGGGRANIGVQYTAQVNGAGFFNVLFGQSYQLFGVNSFAVPDPTNTGLNSGLDTDQSDYVARAAYRPNSMFNFVSRFRFDHSDMDLRRFELESTTAVNRWTLSLLYGNYDAQPALGFLRRREGIAGTAQVKLTTNWNLLASARYDLDEGKMSGTTLGIGYVDDCLIVALNYLTNYSYVGGQQADHLVMLQIALRTIGSTSAAQTVSSNSGP